MQLGIGGEMLDWKECVQRMINYIEEHLREDLTLNVIAAQVGYSQFYCSKAFRKETGICLKDYIRLRRISQAALELRDTERRILDIAVDYGYGSQEAFTRSFIDAFDTTPGAYRRVAIPIPLFLQRNINHQHNGKGADRKMQDKLMQNVKVTFLHKPARKMLVWHQEGATDYHELCDTEGAERIWGILESIKGTLGGVVAAWINDQGMTKYVWGVEMPTEYTGSAPEGFECYLVPECDYVKFSHPDDEQLHEAVTEAVWNVSETWDPKKHGWEWNDADNPVYEDDREDEGYMVLKPIKRI